MFSLQINIVILTVYLGFTCGSNLDSPSITHHFSHSIVHPYPDSISQHSFKSAPNINSFTPKRNPLTFFRSELQHSNQNPFGFSPSAIQFAPTPTTQSTCAPTTFPPCLKSKYRTYDGSCNNLKNPGSGTPNTIYSRLLPAKYADGIQIPPTSVTGRTLPSARLVSIVLFPDVPIPDPVWTLVAMQWGQIITHDMSLALGTAQTKPHANQCCSPDGRNVLPSHMAPATCFPITLPQDDPVHSKFRQQCMNFMRTNTDVRNGCAPPTKAHDQLVAVTHYMDASLVYGSTQQITDSLRERKGGRLLVEVRYGRAWPPADFNKTDTCANQNDDDPCYRFGDIRANQNPQLTVLQIMLLREHNRIAAMLQHLNPHWNDETIFQESRRILIAEFEHINYYEWLPIFLGSQNMLKSGLIYQTHDYVDDYNSKINVNVINSHATAAFRYFHSAIQGHLHLISEHRNIRGALRLSDYFNRPSVIEQGNNFDLLTRGMATQSQEEVDKFFTSEITDFLFRNEMPFGRDLRAIDIQRGRDHGIASYNDYRGVCGLPKVTRFEEFGDYISPENIEKLKKLYESPDDVDLVVGGSLEAHVPNTLTGPTYLCIMIEQFYRTRVGDRYFYENGHQEGAFTLPQLNEIRKASIARLLCDNADQVVSMQREGFRLISGRNPLYRCDDIVNIPIVDLSYWKDEAQHTDPFFFFKK